MTFDPQPIGDRPAVHVSLPTDDPNAKEHPAPGAAEPVKESIPAATSAIETATQQPTAAPVKTDPRVDDLVAKLDELIQELEENGYVHRAQPTHHQPAKDAARSAPEAA